MKNKKIKIAIFHLAFVYSGGGERLVLEEAIGLSKKGFDVTCFAPIINRKNCFPELMLQVRVKTLFPKLPMWIPDIEVFSILFSCVFVPLLFFKFRKYDYYFGANQPGTWISYALSKINKISYACYHAAPTRLIHPRLIDQKTGLKIDDGFTTLNFLRAVFFNLIRFIDTKSMNGCKIIFANGTYAKGLLEEVYGVKAINCPAGAHPKNESVLKYTERLKGSIRINEFFVKKPYILLTNRHFPQKKFEFAIDAFLMLKKKNLNFIITGKETFYTKFLKKKYKNKKNIHFVGLLSEKELDNAYKNALIYAYPSPEEDFGMGIVEGMSYGVPVVAFGNAGPTGIIEHNVDGMLAKPYIVKDYANNIERLLTNENLYKKISKNARQKILDQFTYQRHIDILSKHIKKQLFKTQPNLY